MATNMKEKRERIKQIVKRYRVSLSFSPYERKHYIDNKIARTGEKPASYVKRIFLTHQKASDTFRDE